MSGEVGTTTGVYTITYTATDSAGNTTSAARTVSVEASNSAAALTLRIFDDGLVADRWEGGLNAYDEGISYEVCSNDSGLGCPNISWAIVNDVDRRAVVEASHSAEGKNAGFFVKTSAPYDASDFAGGTLEFDVKIVSEHSGLSMKVDCVYPCSSGNYNLGTISGADGSH